MFMFCSSTYKLYYVKNMVWIGDPVRDLRHLELISKFWNRVKKVSDQAKVCNLEDWRFFVFVNRDDDL